jgi:hypothetical protein
MGKSSVASAWLSVSLVVSTAAFATAFAYKPGSETWTDPAGVAGARHKDLVTTADYYGLQVFQLHQFDKRACLIEMDESTFATRDVGRLDPLKICEPTGGDIWKTADVGSGKYVTAIAVCTGKDKDDKRLFGLELWSASLHDDGELKASAKSTKLEFSECKKWQAKQACPTGSVATGIRGYYDDANQGLDGISLRCNALEPRGK